MLPNVNMFQNLSPHYCEMPFCYTYIVLNDNFRLVREKKSKLRAELFYVNIHNTLFKRVREKSASRNTLLIQVVLAK